MIRSWISFGARIRDLILGSNSRWGIGFGVFAFLLAPVATLVALQPPQDPLAPFQDATGFTRTVSTDGSIDTTNPFFQDLGTNGRRCVTCHQPSDGWTVTPAHLQQRFDETDGFDPIFRTNDGSTSPLADTSTLEARRSAYTMLLTKGLIRVGLPIPANAEFYLEAVDDPYGYASSQELSLFRRPLPATNLTFLSTVMFDGRETFPGQTITFDLMHQANDATLGHAQALQPLTTLQQQQIVAFETAQFSAQAFDTAAGWLMARGALGGPANLSTQQFFLGINDPFQPGFSPVIFTAYDAWADLTGAPPNADGGLNAARESVARGEALFNSKSISITGVGGLPNMTGFCGTCHDTPNVGDHSVPAPLNIGIADASRRTPDMPLYTLRNTTTGETVQTTDPGRALITGKWADIGKFKGPIMRNLAARAPYFHNGSAATLEDVVGFYDTRFSIGLTPAEKADLVAFLRTL